MPGIFQNHAAAPITRFLVIANCAIFFIQSFLGPENNDTLIRFLGLSSSGLLSGMVWQPLTYMFLHGSLLHLFMNMIGLWFAGQALENWLGAKRFLLIYFAGGIAGGLLQAIFFPGGQLIGASGGVFAVLLAVTTLEPEMIITALLFFVLPIRLRAKYLGWGLIGISLALPLLGLDPSVGHLAHLGGALTGMGYAFWLRRTLKYGSRTSPMTAPSSTKTQWSQSLSSSDVDRVLNKVVQDGLHTLTNEERELLERWSHKRS